MNYKKYLRPGKGATDVLPIFFEGEVFGTLIDELVNLFSDTKIDKVACIEGKGFMLGGAVAFKLGVGIAPVRLIKKLRNEYYESQYIDYSGEQKSLGVLKEVINPGEKVLLVDDWVETGNTLKAAIELIEKCGGKIVGIGAFMDDTSEELKEYLKKYNYRYLEKTSQDDLF